MLKLEIISPLEKVLSTEAKQVILPTEMGEVGLLKGHVPLMTQLKQGILKVHASSGEGQYAIKGGYAQLVGNTVSVLTDEACASGAINASDLEAQITTLEKELADLESKAETDTGSATSHEQARVRESLRFCQLQRSLLSRR